MEELERFFYRERTGSFSQVALGTSENITAIISLRKLFTNGIGYDILKYFLLCDINVSTLGITFALEFYLEILF